MTYSNEEKKTLLKVAHAAIEFGLLNQSQMEIDPSQYSELLQENKASFVTLHLEGQLKGCIGSLQAHQSLVQDIGHNAYAAAFLDPRFTPVTEAELPKLNIHLSVLSNSERMVFNSEEDLIRQLRPGIDGLILSDVGRKGTFLPSVWEELSDPKLFIKHLKQKADLAEDYWSDTIQIERYTVEYIGHDA